MRIGIDISVLCDKWDGIGIYVYEQLKYIERTDKENEFFLYADRPLATELQLGDRFHICVDNGSNHLIWLLTRLPKYAKRDRIDVFWQPNFILPFRIPGMRNVVSVHDMSAFAYSEYASTKTNIVHKLFLKPTCRKADKILAISQDCASEIEKYLRVEPSKIQAIYIGKKMFEDGLDATDEQRAECLRKFGIQERDYLLFVGTLSPRKNAEVIVKGYLEYRKTGGTKKLLLAGNIAAKSENIRTLIAESNFGKDIVLGGYISDLDKRILYYHAALLLFPSRLEGFGFPLLEGMQAGIPVITSNVSCMPEIAQDAAVYLQDIDSWQELAQRIVEVENMDADRRARMIARGYERVEYFDQLNYRKRTLEAILSAGSPK